MKSFKILFQLAYSVEFYAVIVIGIVAIFK